MIATIIYYDVIQHSSRKFMIDRHLSYAPPTPSPWNT